MIGKQSFASEMEAPLEEYMISFLKFLTERNVNPKHKEEIASILKKNKVGNLIEFINRFVSNVETNALTYAVIDNNKQMLAFCIKHMNETILLRKDITRMCGGSAFHEAASNADKIELLRMLLADDRLLPLLHNKESAKYFDNPIDVALASKNDAAIILIAKSLNKELPENLYEIKGYGASNISQGILNDKLSNFLKLMKGEDPESYRNLDINDLIDEKGNCQGWATLHEIYHGLGLEKHFFNILDCISDWDESAISLTDIPSTLHGCYNSRKELFNYIISHLVLTQAHSKLVLVDLRLDQEKLKEAFSLLNPGGKYLNEYPLPKFKLNNQNQVVEFLKLLSAFPGSMCDVGIGRISSKHAVSIIITEEGKLKYYDSNFESPEIAQSTYDSETINFFLQYSNNTIGSLATRINGYKLYQISDGPDFKYDMSEVQNMDLSHSPNGLTRLHLAVIAKDIDYIKNANFHEILQSTQGRTPLFEMINSYACDNQVLSILINKIEDNIDTLQEQPEAFFQDLIKSTVVVNNANVMKCCLTKMQPLDQHHDKLEAFMIEAIFKGNKEVVEQLMDSYPILYKSLIKKRFYNKDSLLTLAIDKGQSDIAQMIFNKHPEIIDLTENDYPKHGMNVLMHAIDKNDTLLAKMILALRPQLANNIPQTDSSRNQNALSFSLKFGNQEMAFAILSKCPQAVYQRLRDISYDETNAFIHAVNMNNTEFVLACLEKYPEFVKIINEYALKSTFQMALESAVLQGNTTLTIGILNKVPELVESLLSKDKYAGHNYLTFAIAQGKTELALMLIEHFPQLAEQKIAVENYEDHNALTLAIAQGNKELTLAILNKCPQLIKEVYKDFNCLTYALSEKKDDIAIALLELYPEAARYVIKSGNKYANFNALTFAMEQENVKLAANLLKNTKVAECIKETLKEPEVMDTFVGLFSNLDFAEPLFQFCPEVLEKEVTKDPFKGYNDQIRLYSSLNIPPSTLALIMPDLVFSEERTAPVLKEGYHGYNALEIAIAQNKPDFVRFILEHAPQSAEHVISQGNSIGQTPFVKAMLTGNVEIIESVLKYHPKAIKETFSFDGNENVGAYDLLKMLSEKSSVNEDTLSQINQLLASANAALTKDSIENLNLKRSRSLISGYMPEDSAKMRNTVSTQDNSAQEPPTSKTNKIK